MQSKVKDKSKTTVKHEINDNGMVIERRFTTAGEDPFDLFSWISMDVEIRNPDGTMADSIEGVEFPSGFEGVPGKIELAKFQLLRMKAFIKKENSIIERVPLN